MLLECPVPVRDRPGDGDVPEGRDDPDGPEEDEDVLVVSVLGPQSAGKSLLMNFLFGT